MGASKDLFMEVRLRAEMSEETFSAIPEHLRDEMKIKSIEAVNFKEVYRKDEQWRKFNTLVGDAMEARSEWEARIRIENR
jgi:uncharacterized Fe-S center protein